MDDLISIRKTENNTGLGLFCNRKILKDQIILQFKGSIIWKKEIENLKDSKNNNLLQYDFEKYFDFGSDKGIFANHSCEANCKIIVMANNLLLKAIRDIAAGEEITYDYASTSNEDFSTFKLNCKCGKKSCRNQISGFPTLTKEQKQILLNKDLVLDYLK